MPSSPTEESPLEHRSFVDANTTSRYDTGSHAVHHDDISAVIGVTILAYTREFGWY